MTNVLVNSASTVLKETVTAATSGRAFSTSYTWYAVLLLAVVNVFSIMDRMALALLLPFIKLDLELSDSQLGLLVGFAFTLLHATCAIPIARYADRGNRRDIITLALTIWSLATALCGAAQNFWHLFAARVGVGAGEAGSVPAGHSMMCDYVPLERRSAMFSINTLGIHIGLMLGMSLAGTLGDLIGWRLTFLVLGLPGVVFAVLLKLTLCEPSRAVDEADKNTVRLRLGQTIAILWRCRTYRLLTSSLIFGAFAQQSLHQWLPSFYVRVHGLSLSSVGFSLGIAIGAGSALGVLFGGLLANRAAQRGAEQVLVIGAVTNLVALPAIVISLLVPSAMVSLSLVFVTALLGSVPYGAVVANIYSAAVPGIRATAGAIAIFLASILGGGFAPYCVGALSDLLMTAFGVESLRYALLAPCCFFPVVAVVLLQAARTLTEDLKAVKATSAAVDGNHSVFSKLGVTAVIRKM